MCFSTAGTYIHILSVVIERLFMFPQVQNFTQADPDYGGRLAKELEKHKTVSAPFIGDRPV